MRLSSRLSPIGYNWIQSPGVSRATLVPVAMGTYFHDLDPSRLVGRGSSRRTFHVAFHHHGCSAGAWTIEEDDKLCQLIELHGAKNWSVIASGILAARASRAAFAGATSWILVCARCLLPNGRTP